MGGVCGYMARASLDGGRYNFSFPENTEIYKIPRNDFFFSEIKSRVGLLLAQQITFLGHKKWLATDFWFTSFYCIYDVAVSNQW